VLCGHAKINTACMHACRYGIMGLGAVVHTLNPRLFAVDLEYIINHGVPGRRACTPSASWHS
jgi:acyl-CoA synthetase (AMP-forming)/AMP-acid ligase II